MSLVSFLRHLKNEKIELHLKSGETYTGTVCDVSGSMAVELRDAVQRTKTVPSVRIAGRELAYIVLPEALDIGLYAGEAERKREVQKKRKIPGNPVKKPAI